LSDTVGAPSTPSSALAPHAVAPGPVRSVTGGGGVISGGVSSRTVTLHSPVELLPAASVAR
jgi:hypothetical protein